MLIKCQDCGTLVSDKAAKCPKCGRVMHQEPSVPADYAGIVKLINKLAELRVKFSNFWDVLCVYHDNFATDPFLAVTTSDDPEEYTAPSDGAQAPVKRDLDSDLWDLIDKDDKEGAIKLYQTTTNCDLFQAKEYVFSLMRKPRAAKKPKTDAKPMAGVWQGVFKVVFNVEELKKKNLYPNLEALDYFDEFLDEPGQKYVIVNDAGMAAKIVYDLIVKVFNKNVDTLRFVITHVDDGSDKAKYNIKGEFLEGEGYGEGQFAYYKDPSEQEDEEDEEEEYDDDAVNNSQEVDSASGVKTVLWIVGAVIFIIYLIVS